MRVPRSVSPRRAGIYAILALSVAYATLVEAPGANQMSHYALVRALSHGTARIDAYQAETLDKSYYRGHFYSVKAPALALLTTPEYRALDATGLADRAERAANRLAAGGAASPAAGPAARVRAARGVVWALGLLGTVLPALGLLLLVRLAVERVEPGLGTATAVLVGTGTLLLPFSALFYGHVLSAFLGFGAFVVLWRGGSRLHAAAGAGVLAGLAATAEYPVAAVAVVLAVYAAARLGARSAAAYCAGVVAGLVPLAVYNSLAFGSPAHLSYSDAVAIPGRSGHDVLGLNDPGLFGVGVPKPGNLADLLLSAKGLLVLSPLLALGLVGLVALHRRGLRAEAVAIGAIGLAFLLYDAGYYTPFGGESPGPRFLVPVIPFLAVPLAVVLRRAAGVTLALWGASAAMLAIATLTRPQIGGDDTAQWIDLLRAGDFQYTVAGAAGAGHGWAALIPFVLAAAVALWLATVATGRPTSGPRDVPAALAALACWALLASTLPALLHTAGPRWREGGLLLVAAGALAGLAALGWVRLRGGVPRPAS